MQAQPSTFQGPSLFAGIPVTITKFDEARPLVALIDRLALPYMREEVPELAPLPLALKRMDDANGTDDDELRQRLEAEILRIYGPARDELQRYLAGFGGGAPKAKHAQVASSYITPLTQAPLGPPAIGASPAAASATTTAGVPEHELPFSCADSSSSSPNTKASSQASGGVWDARYKLRWLRTVERARLDMQQLLRERIRLPLTIADPFLAVRLASIIFGEFQVGPCPPRLSHFCDTLSALFGEHLARARGQANPERYSQLEREIISSYPAVLAETRAELESPESAWAKTTREQWEAYRAGNESVWARGAPDESIGVELAINDAPIVSEARGGTNSMPVADIKIPTSRQATVGNVNWLVESMREVGQLQPIVVTPAGELIAGLHRLEAARHLGWTEISVVVLDLDGKKKRLAILDENLVRRQLPALEYAEALHERQQLYESIHPETKQHRAGGASKAAKSASALSAVVESFVTDTSVQTGLRPRTIQEYTQVANISREARNVLRASPVSDKIKELIAVARLPSPEQKAVATILSRGGAKTVKEAVAAVRSARPTAATETTPYALTQSSRIRKQVVEVRRLHAQVETTLEEWQSTDPSGMAPLIKSWTELANFLGSARAALDQIPIPSAVSPAKMTIESVGSPGNAAE